MRPAPSDLIGGKYRIVRLIGDGGMGSVFEARHELLGTPVALKFLHPELARRTGLVPRFLQEARVSASIQSPHVTRVTDVDQAPDGGAYLVMELLTGESLQHLLDRTGRLPRDQSIDFALQMLSGLEAAHALGVVHRDLKPDNVFITPGAGGPLLKLLDFGIAKLRHTNEYQRGLTRPGAVMGTPEYMPPEQLFSADQVDHRADIYSLGAMLYEMLSGKRPAYGDDAPSIVAQVMQGRVQRLTELDPTLPRGLADTVHRALEPDRQHRWSSALEMRLALIPFASRLSPAGRLAAIPPPGMAGVGLSATEDDVAPLSRTPQSVRAAKEPVPAGQRVPPTLAPDGTDPVAPSMGTPMPLAPLPSGKGGTQDVPEQVLQDFASSLQGLPRPGTTPGSPPQLAGGVPAPPLQYGAMASPLAHPYGTTRGLPRARRRPALGAVVALLLGLIVTGGGIAAIVLLRDTKEEPEPSFGPVSDGAPATTITAQPDPTIGSIQATPTVPPPAVTPIKTTGGKTSPKDAGKDGAAEGGFPQFPFPFPSVLPPLPSTLPPLIPSTWPPVFPQGGNLEGER
jgi:serine/threonine-protein kinase